MPTPITRLTLDSAIKYLGECPVVGLDTEGNGFNPRDGTGYLTGISLAMNLGGFYVAGYFPFRHPDFNLSIEDQMRLSEAIENYQGYFAMFNAQFDIPNLRTAGIDYQGRFYDSMVMCHLINENFPMKKDLNGCCKVYLEDESKKEDEVNKVATLVGWANVPFKVMEPYAEYDALLHLRLFEAIKPKLDDENLWDYWEHKQKIIRTVIHMETRGVKIDLELCKRLEHHGTLLMQDYAETLGGNPASSIFQHEILIERLKLPVVKISPKTGKPSFDKETMEVYDQILERVDNPTAQVFKQYRGWQKSVTSNYRPYIELVSPDGKLRCSYNFHRARTGRLSCSKPNLQQIPRVSDKEWNGQMKAAFIPEDGYELWEFDYSQLELRLAAAYCKEAGLLEVFSDPSRDIFTEMSKELGMSRQDTKTEVYSIQYGAGIRRLMHVFGVTDKEAFKMRKDFYDTYPGIQRQTRRAGYFCQHKGKIKLWTGRYRHFWNREEDKHKAFNSVIQGGAADIVEHQMVRLFEEVDNEETCRMLLQVHDSVVFEIKKDVIGPSVLKIKEIMEDVKPNFGVRFKVDAHKWGA